MIIQGFELSDFTLLNNVFRVVIVVALGLLTVYRRELSCNRAYHPDEGATTDERHGPGAGHLRRLAQARLLRDGDWPPSRANCDRVGLPPRSEIRRHRSSSALHSMARSRDDHHHRQQQKTDSKNTTHGEDPTEELLESVGLFFSGGPFLAAAVAVFDHLVSTVFIDYFANGLKSVRANMIADQNNCLPYEDDGDKLCGASDAALGAEAESRTQEKQQQQFYSVGWNAATGYFTDISAKLEGHNNTPSTLCSRPSLSRSKSTGNLEQHLSMERSHALLREMLAMSSKAGMDVTLLPGDAQVGIFAYLPPQDLLAFSCTNKAGRRLLEDGNVIAEETVDDGNKNCDTALLIWKALFQRDFCWVLSEWKIGKVAFQRSMRTDRGQGQQSQNSLKGGNVCQHLVSIILGPDYNDTNECQFFATNNVITSMKDFYFTFYETWLNYTIAGCNSTEKCLIGLHGHVFEISDFVENHPGSTETLLLQAGKDATVFFESMGHSTNARKLAMGMCVVANAECARFHFITSGDEGGRGIAISSPLAPSTWGLMKPSSQSLDIKKNHAGFLIPRKRSRPRVQGGLHRLRQQIQREEQMQLVHASRWGEEVLGRNCLFGDVQVYYDPFCGWRWWYTARDFKAVFIAPSLSR